MKPGATFETEQKERYTYIRQVKYVDDTEVTETNYTGVSSFMNPISSKGEDTL